MQGIANSVVRVAWCYLLLQGCATALPTNLESMTISRMNMADLETSATGYSYQQQHGAPASYVNFNDHGSGHFYNAPPPLRFVAAAPAPAPAAPAHVSAPIAYGAPKTILQIEPVPVHYTNQAPENYEAVQLPPGYIVPLLPQQKEPLAPYYVPVKVEQVPAKIEIVDDDEDESGHGDDDDEDDDEEGHDDADNDDGDDDEEEHDAEPEHRSFDIPTPSFGHGFVEPAKSVATSFEKGDGATHNEGKHSAHGEKGDKGYKSYHGFDKGEKGKHDSENHKGHYSDEAGHKKSHSNTDGHYGAHEEGSKGEGGASFGEAASHKKGHKTSGFHNVYHKDEYKKNTDFYDDDHKSGNFEKHGAFGGHHESLAGGFKKGGHHNSGHAESEDGKKGEFDKGHDHKEAKGHSEAEGRETYHENYADYAAKNAASADKAHGYSKGHH